MEPSLLWCILKMVLLKTKNHTDSNHYSHCKTPKLSAYLLIDCNVLKD